MRITRVGASVIGLGLAFVALAPAQGHAYGPPLRVVGHGAATAPTGDPDAGLADISPRSNGSFSTLASVEAVRQRSLAAASTTAPETAGAWRRYGDAPIIDGGGGYAPQDAAKTFTGRLTDLETNPSGTRLFAAVGLSGIFESRDLGAHWRLLTRSLPNTTAGAVGFSTAEGGTIFDGTGDRDGGFLGQGIFRSTNDGRTWHKAKGVPNGLMTAKIAVDPTNPNVVYAATHRGLFRSTNDGRSFTNVRLPTGHTYTDGSGPNCAGDVTHPQCALNNYVTDVVVRPSGGGDKGGEVLAAVGWERGVHPTSKGWNNALGNGLYASSTGKPGTFTNLNASSHGFTRQSHIGRISLGEADGPGQDHDVIWAMVQDAQAENAQFPLVDPIPIPGAVPPPCAVAPCFPTLLENIYVSYDFGKTWQAKLPTADSLGVSCPVSSTDQCFLMATGIPQVSPSYSPGVQAQYNNYIRPDPTLKDAQGRPTRIIFGLEELWEINLNDPKNASGTVVVPKTIGRYFGGKFCPAGGGLTAVSYPPACPFQNEAPTTTHPDQHAGVFVPDGKGGVTYVAGNDGGAFVQHVAKGGDFDNAHWGSGRNGMPTALQYGLAVSGDGNVYSGLQDNGEIRITPSGKQYEIFGGDGGISATDPHNSKIVYEEYVGGDIAVSVDRGHTWRDINPLLTNPQFTTPFVMDPTDPDHLLVAGEDIDETVSGANTASGNGVTDDPTAWATVYNMGTYGAAGDPNQATALATRGNASYVAYCGPCYVYSTVSNFHRGIATNVGGSKPGHTKSADGWHLVAAKGLPQRYITSVQIDPSDNKTIYVSLAQYDPSVDYRRPGVLGDAAAHLGHGHVYRSTDGGKTFTDISGNLPNAPAGWVTLRGNQLIAGTNVGVYISKNLAGGTWRLLGGTSLPVTRVTALALQPGNHNRLYASTYGMGTWLYRFPHGTFVPHQPPTSPENGGPGDNGDGLATTGLASPITWIGLGAVIAAAGLMRRRRVVAVS